MRRSVSPAARVPVLARRRLPCGEFDLSGARVFLHHGRLPGSARPREGATQTIAPGFDDDQQMG